MKKWTKPVVLVVGSEAFWLRRRATYQFFWFPKTAAPRIRPQRNDSDLPRPFCNIAAKPWSWGFGVFYLLAQAGKNASESWGRNRKGNDKKRHVCRSLQAVCWMIRPSKSNTYNCTVDCGKFPASVFYFKKNKPTDFGLNRVGASSYTSYTSDASLSPVRCLQACAPPSWLVSCPWCIWIPFPT